jgi:2-aminoadipate transaminase
MEHDGLDVDYLERLIAREKIKLLITIPTLHNPTGTTMSLEKRQRLVALAQKHGIAIIEDNWALFLGVDGKREPSLKTLDAGSHVIQIGSFSKCFLPGTRVAWAVLPVGLSASFVRAKRALDRSDSYFLQTLVHEFISKGYFDLHLRKLDRIYRARRELMEELMLAHFPSDTSWKKPTGGFSCWINLPPGITGEALLRRTVEHGVDFAPGSFFNVGHRDTSTIRLAFSALTQPQLRQGLRRLGNALHEALSEKGKVGLDAS